MYYRAYGVTVASDLALPELGAVELQQPDLIVVGGPDVADRSAWRWVARRPDDSAAPWLSIGVRDGARLLAFGGGIDFTVSEDVTTIVCHRNDGIPATTLRHLLIDQVVPLVLAQRGSLVLHGSACVLDEAAVAFVGGPGTGKSSLAAALSRAGAAILADDAVRVDVDGGRASASLAYAGVRVWPDMLPAGTPPDRAPSVAHYTSKRRLTAGDGLRFGPDRAPLRDVFVLDTNPASGVVAVEDLAARQAVLAILRCSFLLDVLDRTAVTAHFDRAAMLCGHVRVRTLRFPRRADLLPRVLEAVGGAVVA
jgi:hypothetical protein